MAKYPKQIIERIKKHLELCKPFTKFNIFKVDKSESIEHNLKMAYQFVYLVYNGYAVAVRPELKNRNKPDLLILNTKKPIIKEIMVTEKDKRFLAKGYMGIKKIKVKV